MTTPVAAQAVTQAAPTTAARTQAARTGGRTSQGRTPAPSPQQRGSFRPPTQSPPGQTARRGGRTQQSSAQISRAGGRTQQGTQGGRSVRPGPAGKPGATKRPTKRPSFAPRRSKIRRRGLTQREGTNYQPAILAEFVAAIILVSATPFATSKNPEGLSPYAGSDIVKLLALTLTYFLLALISSASRGAGKVAAVFGLLVLLTVGLNEAANLVQAFDLFAGIPLPGTPAGKHGGSSMQ